MFLNSFAREFCTKLFFCIYFSTTTLQYRTTRTIRFNTYTVRVAASPSLRRYFAFDPHPPPSSSLASPIVTS